MLQLTEKGIDKLVDVMTKVCLGYELDEEETEILKVGFDVFDWEIVNGYQCIINKCKLYLIQNG